MRRFKPLYGALVVLAFLGTVLVAQLALEGRFAHSGYERVAPGRDGLVRIGLGDLKPEEVRFFRFLNTANQEVKFFVGRDGSGTVQVGFDANEICAKSKRGYRSEKEWLVCNKCDKAFKLAEVNAGGGGCKPVPVKHQVAGKELVVAEAEILEGWRLFR
jgi:uncharacterized membrane protein